MSVAAEVAGQHGHFVIALRGALDFHTVADVRGRLRALDQSATSKTLVVDMSQLEFLDSSGLGMLVSAHKRAVARGDSLILICPERLRRIFRVTGLETVLAMYASIPDALQ